MNQWGKRENPIVTYRLGKNVDPGILETGKELTCGEIFLKKNREISVIFPFISLSGILPVAVVSFNALWGRMVIDFPREWAISSTRLKFKIIYLLLKIYLYQ